MTGDVRAAKGGAKGPGSRAGGARSLRLRLIAVILPPLIGIAALAGAWQLSNARAVADEVGDGRLLLTALAVAYDVTLSGGDALTPRTLDLLSGGGDGPLFYHVYAPDGVIVTGYATPPVGVPRAAGPAGPAEPVWFEATYRGAAVRGVRIRSVGEVDGIGGQITTTVWRDAGGGLAAVLAARSLAVIGGLIASVALVVWFGVGRGLRPLADLEAAIAARSGDDLSPILRPVPAEVRGVAGRLNDLLAQVRDAMAAQTAFVADAAHQLRNPIAGVLALAEAVARAPDAGAARERAADLLDAARRTAALTDALLMLERASAGAGALRMGPVDLSEALPTWARAAEAPPGVTLSVRAEPLTLRADATMLGEAVGNLVDNALRHGGPGLGRIDVTATRRDGQAVIAVHDDGRGAPAGQLPSLVERFRQGAPGEGSGLGLSIAAAVAGAHGGALHLSAAPPGLRAEIRVPLSAPGA